MGHLDIAVHDALRVAVVQRLEQLVDVVAHVQVAQRGVQHLEVRVVDVLKHQRGRLGLRLAHDVQHLDDVRPACGHVHIGFGVSSVNRESLRTVLCVLYYVLYKGAGAAPSSEASACVLAVAIANGCRASGAPQNHARRAFAHGEGATHRRGSAGS